MMFSFTRKSAVIALAAAIILAVALSACSKDESATDAHDNTAPAAATDSAKTNGGAGSADAEQSAESAAPSPTPYVPQIVTAVDELVSPSFDFETVFEFIKSEKYGYIAGVKKDGKWGFIDTQGTVVIPFEYDSISNDGSGVAYGFRNGRQIVGKDGKYGFIDSSGELVIPCVYGYWSHTFANERAIVEQDGKYGIIDTDGKEIVPIIYDSSIASFSDGLAKTVSSEGWIFFNTNGEIALTVPTGTYFNVGSFSDGLAAVIKNVGDAYAIGYIDKNGDEVIKPQYYGMSASDFHNGVAIVADAMGNAGLIDKTGRVVIPLIYDGGHSYSTSSKQITFSKSNGENYLFDIEGNLLNVASYGSASNSSDYNSIDMFKNGFAKVTKDTKIGFVNENYELVVPCIYNGIGTTDFTIDGFAVVSNIIADNSGNSVGVLGMIDTTGREILPVEYDLIQSSASSGLLLVSKHKSNTPSMILTKMYDNYGFANIAGDIVVPEIYEEVTHFVGGFALVKKDGLWGILHVDESKNVDKVMETPISKAPAVKTDASDWKAVFAEFLTSKRYLENTEVNGNTAKFALRDLDSDGAPELLISKAWSEEYFVYIIGANKSVTCIGAAGSNYGTYVSADLDYPGFFGSYAQNQEEGVETAFWYTSLHDGRLTTETYLTTMSYPDRDDVETVLTSDANLVGAGKKVALLNDAPLAQILEQLGAAEQSGAGAVGENQNLNKSLNLFFGQFYSWDYALSNSERNLIQIAYFIAREKVQGANWSDADGGYAVPANEVESVLDRYFGVEKVAAEKIGYEYDNGYKDGYYRYSTDDGLVCFKWPSVAYVKDNGDGTLTVTLDIYESASGSPENWYEPVSDWKLGSGVKIVSENDYQNIYKRAEQCVAVVTAYQDSYRILSIDGVKIPKTLLQ